MRQMPVLFHAAVALCAAIGFDAAAQTAVVERPDAAAGNEHYFSNRAPLLPSMFVKLPVGAVEPRGWVRKQLELQAAGFIGHLPEISNFLKKEGNAWLDPEGKGQRGWEEVPYWLKGFGDTGYVLRDERIIEEARFWVEAILKSQRADGYFGPRSNLTNIRGTKPDLWPQMIAMFCLQSYHEFTGDKRVLDLMTKYFHWELTVADEDFLEPYWQNQRGADNLFSVYWLYNRTGDKRLLELAPKVHRNTANWTDDIPNWHNVNMSQAFGGPTTYYLQSKDPKHLVASERNYAKMRAMYGQAPGGTFGGDENCRVGFSGPRQAIETCGAVEMMLSHETLLRITGNPIWADRCEDVTFNTLPATMTSDLKALRYLTAPNMVLSDAKNKNPGLQNGGPMLHLNPHGHRCCQHNMGHGWPYYAQNLWLAAPGNGLAAALYAPCAVKAKVDDGTEIQIVEETRYPFEEEIAFTITAPRPVKFPLYLRVPGWCDEPQVRVNGVVIKTDAKPLSYIRLARQWNSGDKLRLTLPAKVALTTWTENKNSVSVHRGPLTYSLKIGEKYVRQGGTDKWPAWEIHPTTPWNYGLVLDAANPAAAFGLDHKNWPADDQPFKANAAPLELTASAKLIPNWQLDHLGLVGKIQPSPIKSDQPTATVTLIPMGCARLRVSAFPVIGDGPDAHEWAPPPPRMASHASDSIEALTDGKAPKDSNDHTIPRFTWWSHKGSREWVQVKFDKPRRVSSVEVYWFDDTGRGECRVPQSWRLLYQDGDEFKPVTGASEYGVAKDQFNKVAFDPVQTDLLRLEVQLRPNVSGGILEVRTK